MPKRNRLFYVLVTAILVANIVVQVLEIDTFPLSHYPMYSTPLPGDTFRFYTLCSQDRGGFIVPSRLTRPIYIRYLAASAEKWKKAGDNESIQKMFRTISETAALNDISIDPKGMYFSQFVISKSAYIDYLTNPLADLPKFDSPCRNPQRQEVEAL